MQILITRHRKTNETIDGSRTIDGSLRLCNTAENVATALPSGVYPLSIVKCRKYARKMPVIKIGDCSSCKRLTCIKLNRNQPQVCHLLKPGNGVYHREDGSIIVGTFICPGCLKHSRAAFDTLYERLRKSIERGNEVTLKIINA